MAKFYLYPESLESGGTSFSPTRYDYVDDAYGGWDDDGTYNTSTSGGSGTDELRYNATPFVPSQTAINSVTVGVRVKHISGGTSQTTALVRISGTTYSGTLTNVTTSYANYTKVWTTNPATGLAWTLTELNALIIGAYMSWAGAGREDRITGIWAEVDYTGAAAPSNSAQDMGSRRVHDFQNQQDMVGVNMPLHLGLDLELMDTTRVAHFAGPHATDDGWRPSEWQARLLRVYDITETPGSPMVRVVGRDLRRLLCLLRDDGWTGRPVGALGDGVIRIQPGSSVQFTRASNDWVYDPASGLITQVVDNQDPYTDGGRLAFGQSKAWLIRNTFKDGSFTGWTANGTGTNGSAINVGDSDPWDSGSTGVSQSAEIVAGSPATVDTYLVGTNTGTINANTKLWVSILYKTVAGDPLRITARRIVDLNYWDGSGAGSWAAGITWNALPDTGGDWAFYTWPVQMDVGGSNTAIGVRIGFESGVTSGSQGNAYCWLLEDGSVPSWAPIITAAAAVTRSASQWIYSNNDTARVWSNDQGAFACEVTPNWGPSDIGNTNKTVAWISHDASNWEWIYYDGTNDRWVYERRVAGSTYRAVKSATPVKGTNYKIVARWTGTNAELGLTAYTISIFVDGVKGTDATPGAAPTQATNTNLEIGSKSTAEHFDGRIRLIRSLQWVPNDSEVGRMPL